MSVKFYSAWYCPFAQRAWMTLLLKQIDFEYIEVDPYQDSAWWKTISRGHNLVPVLVVDNDHATSESTIVDSTRVVEYLQEVQPDLHPLLPDNFEQRAEIRYWADHINQRIVPYIYRFLDAQEPGDYRDESRAALVQNIEHIFSAMMPADQPYFGGLQANMLDLLLVSFAYRIDALLGHYRDFSLPQAGEVWQSYKRWYEAMTNHPVFIQSQSYGDDYRQALIEHYLPYTKGEGQQDVKQAN